MTYTVAPRAAAAAACRRGRRVLGEVGVVADRQAEVGAADPERESAGARGEDAALTEMEVLLVIGGDGCTVRRHDHVAEASAVTAVQGGVEDDQDAGGIRGVLHTGEPRQVVQCGKRAGEDRVVVAGHERLGEDDDVDALVCRLSREIGRARDVAIDRSPCGLGLDGGDAKGHRCIVPPEIPSRRSRSRSTGYELVIDEA